MNKYHTYHYYVSDRFSVGLVISSQDSVRIQVVSICIALTQIFPAELKMSEVLPVVLAIAADRSWRVRWSLAVKLFQVAQGMGSQAANNSLAECFEDMLRDQEAEVRRDTLDSSLRFILLCFR